MNGIMQRNILLAVGDGFYFVRSPWTIFNWAIHRIIQILLCDFFVNYKCLSQKCILPFHQKFAFP